MSWNYALHQINHSFEQIAHWYREFMHRTEQAFRQLHQRITYLEERQEWQAPSDEQLERVLRKILAERFAGSQYGEQTDSMKEDVYFVRGPKDDFAPPKPIAIDIASLQADPEAVPSKSYQQDFDMLQSKLTRFPHVDSSQRNDQAQDGKEPPNQFRRPDPPQTTHHCSRRSS